MVISAGTKCFSPGLGDIPGININLQSRFGHLTETNYADLYTGSFLSPRARAIPFKLTASVFQLAVVLALSPSIGVVLRF